MRKLKGHAEARDYVRNNRDNWMDLLKKHATFTEIMRVAGFSVFHFRPAFKAEMGVGIREWCTAKKYNVKRAINPESLSGRMDKFVKDNQDHWPDMLDKHSTFQDVALAHGFSPSAFGRHFEVVMGMTLTEWYQRSGYRRNIRRSRGQYNNVAPRKAPDRVPFLRNHGPVRTGCPFFKTGRFPGLCYCTNPEVIKKAGARGDGLVCACCGVMAQQVRPPQKRRAA